MNNSNEEVQKPVKVKMVKPKTAEQIEMDRLNGVK